VAGWHLVLHLKSHRLGVRDFERHQVQLFDLGSDPACLENRADSEDERVRALRALLIDWCQQSSADSLVGERQPSPDQLAQLAALGYTTGVWLERSDAWIEADCDCDRCRDHR